MSNSDSNNKLKGKIVEYKPSGKNPYLKSRCELEMDAAYYKKKEREKIAKKIQKT